MNDYVSIANPKKGQPREGHIIGTTKQGFCQIRGRAPLETEDQVILRIPSNLILIQRNSSGTRDGVL